MASFSCQLGKYKGTFLFHLPVPKYLAATSQITDSETYVNYKCSTNNSGLLLVNSYT